MTVRVTTLDNGMRVATDSMQNVEKLWLPELRKLGRKRMRGGATESLCPVVLVGLRTETREKSLFGEAAEEERGNRDMAGDVLLLEARVWRPLAARSRRHGRAPGCRAMVSGCVCTHLMYTKYVGTLGPSRCGVDRI